MRKKSGKSGESRWPMRKRERRNRRKEKNTSRHFRIFRRGSSVRFFRSVSPVRIFPIWSLSPRINEKFGRKVLERCERTWCWRLSYVKQCNSTPAGKKTFVQRERLPTNQPKLSFRRDFRERFRETKCKICPESFWFEFIQTWVGWETERDTLPATPRRPCGTSWPNTETPKMSKFFDNF